MFYCWTWWYVLFRFFLQCKSYLQQGICTYAHDKSETSAQILLLLNTTTCIFSRPGLCHMHIIFDLLKPVVNKPWNDEYHPASQVVQLLAPENSHQHTNHFKRVKDNVLWNCFLPPTSEPYYWLKHEMLSWERERARQKLRLGYRQELQRVEGELICNL